MAQYTLQEQTLFPRRKAAEVLPKPLKPAKSLTLNNVVATIREGRDSCKISLS